MAQRKQLSGLDLASQKIVGMADGSVATDAATYGQVLNLVNGKDYKDGVVAASQANVTLTAPGTSIDGVTLAVGDRVLLLAQTTASQNGIWVFQGSAVTMTRPTDFPTGSTGLVSQGATVVVDGGTTNKATQWTLTTTGVINVDTTSLAFTETTAVGATYTADSAGGLQLVTGAFSVKLPASSGLIKDSTGLYVDPAIVLTKAFGVLVGDGSSTAITVTHNKGTRDVIVALYDASTNAEVDTDIVHATTNTVTLNFAVAPASNAYRCVVIG
jgi:hypothetical protein